MAQTFFEQYARPEEQDSLEEQGSLEETPAETPQEPEPTPQVAEETTPDESRESFFEQYKPEAEADPQKVDAESRDSFFEKYKPETSSRESFFEQYAPEEKDTITSMEASAPEPKEDIQEKNAMLRVLSMRQGDITGDYSPIPKRGDQFDYAVLDTLSSTQLNSVRQEAQKLVKVENVAQALKDRSFTQKTMDDLHRQFVEPVKDMFIDPTVYGANAMVSGMNNFLANIPMMIADAGQYMNPEDNFVRGVLRDAEKYFRDQAKYHAPDPADAPNNFVGEIVSTAVQLPGEVAKVLGGVRIAASLGVSISKIASTLGVPVAQVSKMVPQIAKSSALNSLGFGLASFTGSIDKGLDKAIEEGKKGAGLGAVFGVIGGLPLAKRVGSMATTMGAAEIPSGDLDKIKHGFAVGGLLGYIGPKNIKEFTYKKYQQEAGELFTELANSKKLKGYDPFGKLEKGDRSWLLEQRYEYMGKLDFVERTGHAFNKALSKEGRFKNFSKQDQKNAYKFLTDRIDPEIINDPKLRDAAIRAKESIDYLGRQAVERGLMTEGTRLEYESQYLPRVYLKHLLKNQKNKVFGTSKVVVEGDRFKPRDDFLEKEIREEMGEIKDPGYLVEKTIASEGRDFATIDYLTKISKRPTLAHKDSLVDLSVHPELSFINGKRVSVFSLKRDAIELTERADLLTGPARDRVLAQAKAIRDVIKPRIEKLRKNNLLTEDKGLFKQVPDTPQYGRLRGMYLRKEVYNDLIGSRRGIDADATLFEKMLGHGGWGSNATRVWKMMKVPLNPPSQVRNTVSNGILLHLSGVDFLAVPFRVAQAVKEIATNGKHYQIFKENGGTETTFTKAELTALEKGFTKSMQKTDSTFSMANMAKVGADAAKMIGRGTTKGASASFQYSEGVFKVAKIIDAMKKGASPKKAALEAQEALFDYSLVPEPVRYMRENAFGMPFITFQYKVLPRLIETAFKRPHKFLPYLVGLPYMFNKWMMEKNDVTQEDVEALKQSMPEFLLGKVNAYIWPVKDKLNRWVPTNIDYFLPWSMPAEVVSNIANGDAAKAMKTVGLFASPAWDIGAAVKTNKDGFTGQEISNKNDTPQQQVSDIVNYMWRLSAPPWVTDRGFAGKLYDRMNNKMHKRTGKQTLTKTEIVLKLFGVNTYPFNAGEQRRTNIFWQNREIKDTQRRMIKRIREAQMMYKGNPAEERRKKVKEIRDDFIQEIKKKQKKLKDYMKKSRIPDKLK